MEDIGYCPKPECAEVATIDKEKNFGRCNQCSFQFCLTCEEKYHFFKQCPAIKVTKEEAKQLISQKLEMMQSQI